MKATCQLYTINQKPPAIVITAVMLFGVMAGISGFFRANAQSSIRLAGGSLSLTSVEKAATLRWRPQMVEEGAGYYWVAQFNQLPALEALKAWDVELCEKLAPNVFWLYSKKVVSISAQQTLGVAAIGNMDASVKLGGELAKGGAPAHAMQGSQVRVWLALLNPTAAEARHWLQARGFVLVPVAAHNHQVFETTLSLAEVQQLANLPYIAYLQPAPPPAKTLNINSRAFSGAFLPRMPVGLGGKGLNGEGITVGVGDDADPTLHPDLFDRVINHSPGMTNNHGTHVAGTVGGAGILGYRYAGFAPMVRLIAQFFEGVWKQAAQYVAAYQMAITNNSYGLASNDCIYNGVYDLNARLLDEQAFSYPSLLHCFAAGNDGGLSCAPYPSGYFTVLGGYQSAKNIITVGRTDYNQLGSVSSSAGPVADGRLKPEITALGIIESTNGSGGGYFGSFGTSMSSPGVAGGLALLYQRYRQLHSGAYPMGHTMKALLLNGAMDIGTPGPDYKHGYGYMNLERSLRMLEASQYSQRTINHGQVQDTVINVPSGTAQLKVMLYWHDPAALPFASKTLVHNLDLEVIAPGGGVNRPLILQAGPANVQQPATQGVDAVNNSEQVVIAAPVPGNYTLRVKGTDVLAGGSQRYALAFDKQPAELRFLNPVANDAWPSGTVGFPGGIPLVWEDEGNPTGTYTLDYSLDDGSTWTNIFTGLADSMRNYFWIPGNIRSPQTRLRLAKTGVAQPAISGRFALIPNVSFSLAANIDQCQGYARINWTALTAGPGETIDYQVLMKQGPAMEVVATTTANTYTLAGLHPDSTYYIAVRARINGVHGIYERTVNRRPNTGNCSGNISDFDLRLDSITAPLTGRQFTSTALGTQPVQVRVRNLDNTPVNSYSIEVWVNGTSLGGPQVINTPIIETGIANHSIGSFNFSNPGTYNLMAVVKNLQNPDPVAQNDTFRTTIRQLANSPITLTSPFTDDLEDAADQTAIRGATGVANTQRWDFTSTDQYGRARTSATPGVARSGQRAFTLDVSKATPLATSAANSLVGTFNLSGASTSQPVRLDFYYKQHGIGQGPHPQNKVWVRGNDAATWLEVYDLALNQPVEPGEYKQSASLPIAQVLAANGQAFSTSTQIRLGQFGLYSMADEKNLSGYSFDDFKLYLAENDAQLLAIDTPAMLTCGLGSLTPVRITVRNSTSTAMSNVPVSYSINGGTPVQEIIPTIAANSQLIYEFTQTANFSTPGVYQILATVDMPGDNVPQNNSIQAVLRQQQVVTAYPYLQDFEQDAGGFVTGGIRSSWAWGQPASRTITKAASGTKAWKTNLTGDYNNTELSYLYSPCFDLSSLAQPALSFAVAYDLEDCTPFNALCDAAWVEYSYDRVNWQKLGASGQGTNWYDQPTYQVFTKKYQDWWHVATIGLPKQPGLLSFRFVMQSDLLTARQGIAIDDIHVYDNATPMYAEVGNSNAISLSVTGNTWVPFADGGKLLAAVNAQGNNLGNTLAKLYKHGGPLRTLPARYVANRNWVVQASLPLTDPPAKLRLYFTDEEVNELRTAAPCPLCQVPKDYTMLGVVRYSDANTSNEDGSLDNNTQGFYQSMDEQDLRFVPYDKGYYVELPTEGFSEYWLTTGGSDIALPARWLSFDAKAVPGTSQVVLQWQTAEEKGVRKYEAECMGPADNGFVTIGTVLAQGTQLANYSLTDARPGKQGSYAYRIKMLDVDGRFQYSPVKVVSFGKAPFTIKMFPNPANGQPVQILLTGLQGSQVQWRIVNAQGQAIYSKAETPAADGSLQTKLPALIMQKSKGLYLLVVQDGDAVHTSKLIW